MLRLYISCLLTLGMATCLSAQNIEQAKQHFQKGEFTEAKPIFRNYLKKSPNNGNYNYWYGVCEYETGNSHAAIPYLKKGASAKVSNAYRYLGLAYYDIYKFEDSETSYEQYIASLVKAKKPTSETENEMEKIKKASRMIKGVEKVTVVDSIVVDKKTFLDAYYLSKSSGKLSMIPNSNGTSYETENGNNIILSQTSEKGNMQLYTKMKLINNWSKPETIPSLQNESNMNYPFLMADGITLYYSSDGPESLGGFDIFVTRYDSDEGKYLKPDNIGMPFNSPYNDYMYAIDEMNNIGWFASDRFQPDDKVCIYLFIPNEIKDVYDYDNTDATKLEQAALLTPISVAQGDKQAIKKAKEMLASIIHGEQKEIGKKDFEFVIDDNRTYHKLSDFKSKEARSLYQQVVQKQKDIQELSSQLSRKRDEYASAQQGKKSSLAPSIIDLERRTEQMSKEIEKLIVNVRNKEITWK